MAQFYAEIQGNRGAASRMGAKTSGIWGHIRGWHVGAKVTCSYDEETDSDIVHVYKTKGSSGGSDILIATIYESGEIQFSETIKEEFGITLHPPKGKVAAKA